MSVLALGMAAVALLLIWSATHGANITSSAKDLLAGRPPATGSPG